MAYYLCGSEDLRVLYLPAPQVDRWSFPPEKVGFCPGWYTGCLASPRPALPVGIDLEFRPIDVLRDGFRGAGLLSVRVVWSACQSGDDESLRRRTRPPRDSLFWKARASRGRPQATVGELRVVRRASLAAGLCHGQDFLLQTPRRRSYTGLEAVLQHVQPRVSRSGELSSPTGSGDSLRETRLPYSSARF